MNLPEKLAALRKEKGLTQIELAEKLMVSRQAISRWEVGSGVPSTDNLKMLSELYGVTVDYLLHDHAAESGEPVEKPVQVQQEPKPPKRQAGDKSRQHVVFFVGALIILVMILIGSVIGRMTAQKPESGKVTPIGEMDNEAEDYSTDSTFSIG